MRRIVAADIGGTHARFAIATLDGGKVAGLGPPVTLKTEEHASFQTAWEESGVATASDILRGVELGLDRFKFFPAQTSGGVPALKALAGPFANVRFCPTGGITADTTGAWLALEAVLCVGGSWIVRPGEADLAAVAERACEAASLADAESRSVAAPD